MEVDLLGPLFEVVLFLIDFFFASDGDWEPLDDGDGASNRKEMLS